MWLTLSSDEISIWGHFGSVCHVDYGVPKCTPDVLSASHAVLASLNLVAELDGARRPGLVVISRHLEKKTLLVLLRLILWAACGLVSCFCPAERQCFLTPHCSGVKCRQTRWV